MLGSFLIFLREGIEGSMIVAIMCTYLANAGRRDLFKWVFMGVGSALVVAGVAATAMYALVKQAFVDSDAQTWFETGTFFLAVVILTYMTFWMKRNARSINKTLSNQMSATITGGSAFALALLAFVTVGREAVETAIFLLAIAFANSAISLLAGAVIGLSAALGVSVAIYHLGVRLNFKRFFTIMGGALMFVAAGLLSDGIQNLQELGVLPGAGHSLWDMSGVISEDSNLGDVLHGLIGYAAAPTPLQVGAWVLFLVVGLAFFLDKPASLFVRGARRTHERTIA